MPQRVVRVILEGHPRSRVPLGVLLTKALLGVRPEPQLLTFTELHKQDVCGVWKFQERKWKKHPGFKLKPEEIA